MSREVMLICEDIANEAASAAIGSQGHAMRALLLVERLARTLHSYLGQQGKDGPAPGVEKNFLGDPEPAPPVEQANLRLATTAELLAELAARADQRGYAEDVGQRRMTLAEVAEQFGRMMKPDSIMEDIPWLDLSKKWSK